MGESMSKRLKLQLGGEAEMEERAFPNPYPDYQPQGAGAAAAAPSVADTLRDKSPLPAEEEPLPFGADGKVSPGPPAGPRERRGGPAACLSRCGEPRRPCPPAGLGAGRRADSPRAAWRRRRPGGLPRGEAGDGRAGRAEGRRRSSARLSPAPRLGVGGSARHKLFISPLNGRAWRQRCGSVPPRTSWLAFTKESRQGREKMSAHLEKTSFCSGDSNA